jgi:hypothetical protein
MATTLSYYVHTDEFGFPIPSTMMGFKTKPTKYNNLVLLPTTQMTVGGGTRVYQKNGLRYFYRLDKKGKIEPNSLIISKKKPFGNTLEYIKVK